ncbi:MAG: choloylglycine hydrolase family protein [Ruminococcaceae bacterium]|nr:choloylglycine hydrolase family protein [Oscillospiraceae bacterium]
MCTAVTYKTQDFYFGRTLDYEFSYGEEVTITPRNFAFNFRNIGTIKSHYAIIGMAHIADGYPLYYDAANEKGLCMAGLNFVGNAHYNDECESRDNIAQFEFTAWILSKCACVTEAEELIKRINLTNTPFSDSLPPSPLHWIIADSNRAITVESVKQGIRVYDNAVGVLTNNPPFNEQMFNLNNYMHLSSKAPHNNFSDKLPLKPYSRGMGALGLPGDLSSQSRFVRAAFVKMNSVSGSSEEESVNQFFHILGSVQQQRGCCELGDGKFEITIYTSCINADKGIYYYTTYANHQITAINMQKEALNSCELISYPLISGEQIKEQN